jgi:D12 class N6 adenine-specific DNA methyltransferase
MLTQETRGEEGPGGQMVPLKSPYPYFGGKATIAPRIWQALGDCANVVDPFFGSGAVLLSRPHPPRLETVNDIDSHIPNFWRAMQHDPVGLAALCDTPVFEVDQTAFHAWLIEPGRRDAFTARLMGDPDYYDLVRAARWCAGLCMWIGNEWCSGKGPWQSIDGSLVQANGPGITRQRVHLGNPGQGVPRRCVQLRHAGQGVHRKRVHLGGHGGVGVHKRSLEGGNGLDEWFAALQARIRHVRVCCGDWTRVLGPSVTWKNGGMAGDGMTGIVLDPPYETTERDADIYAIETPQIAANVRAWALANGDNPRLRIALCGYETPTYTMPTTWQKLSWTTQGGYGNQRQAGNYTNRYRETVWFSPACLPLDGSPQLSLFGA